MRGKLFEKYYVNALLSGKGGCQHIQMIKEYRELTGMGLKESKDVCDTIRDKQLNDMAHEIMDCVNHNNDCDVCPEGKSRICSNINKARNEAIMIAMKEEVSQSWRRK